MDSGPEMSSSLLSGGDENASQQSSLRSGKRSLLERIQLQREKDATTASVAPQQIQVPNYAPVRMEGHGSDSLNNSDSGGGGMFQNAWNQMGGAAPSGGEESAMGDALLPPTAPDATQEYSMGGYFMTFVRDVYHLFMAMPMVLRVVVVIFLLFVAYKLL